MNDHLLDFLNFLTDESNDDPLRGEVISTDTFTNGKYEITVDTCFTNDTKRYETAIIVNDTEWEVVEEYETPDDASAGHDKWMNICRSPRFSFYSVQTGEIFIYE